MTTEQAAYRRVLRRETHSSRSVAAVVAASVAVVLLLALLVGGVWSLLDPRFGDAASVRIAELTSPDAGRVSLIVSGAVAVVVALILLLLAVLPGRRARRARTTERVALLVDDGVLADAVADAVAARCGIDRRQVSVTLARRRVTVRVTPTSGIRIDESAVAETAVGTVSDLGFVVTPKVYISERGVVA